MNRTFLTILRECLQTNALLQKGLLAYSLLLIVLGAQLPLNFYLYTTLAVTPLLIFWFMTYSRWNHSAEFLSTLPDFNRYKKNARITGGVLISLPFYVINGLSMLRDLTGYRGQYESVGAFTIKAIVFMTIYLIAFRIIAGKTVKTPANLFFRKVRMIFALAVILFTSFLGYAFYKNLGFYESIPLITNPQRLVPSTFKDKESYECANPDQLLINVYVTQYDDPQKVSYISHKILQWEPGRSFELSLGELPNATKRFEKIILQIVDNKIKLHDANITKKSKRFGRDLQTTPLQVHKLSSISYKTDFGEESFKDPWYRRLFSVLNFSIKREETIECEFIPFASSTDTLIKAVIAPNSKQPEIYDEHLDYFMDTASQIDHHEYKKFSVRKNGYELEKRNFIPILPFFYLLVGHLLISGFILYKFNNLGQLLHTLYVLWLMIFIDFSLTEDKLRTLASSQGNHFIMVTAATDLNTTIHFRDYAAAHLKEICNQQDPQLIKPAFLNIYVNWLMLINKPNPLMESYFDGINLYDTNLDGKYNLSMTNLFWDPTFHIGKQITQNMFFCRCSWNVNTRIHLLPHSHFNMELLETVEKMRSSEFKERLESFKKKTKEEKRQMLKADPVFCTYMLHEKTRLHTLLKQKEKLPTDLFHGFIPISPEEQWKALLK